jgi:hypothetical protein
MAKIRASISDLLRSTGALFQTPFNGLGLVLILYIFFSYVVYPHSGMLRGDFPDTDDYMYLNQVLDWLKGQGWYDNIQHRLDPPHGAPIHFSRLAQLPMAALILFFEAVGFGPRGAATLMATLYPVLLLGGLFVALRWLAQSFVSPAWVRATALIGFFATSVIYMFRPGHVDHHGLMLIFIAVALGCVLRMMERPDQNRWPIYTGMVLAVGQTIALEILPWLLLLSGWIGLWCIIKGAKPARQGLLYGLILTATSFVCLLLTRPPSDLITVDVLTYSIVYVILAAGITVPLAGIALAGGLHPAFRWVVGCLLGGGAAFLFLHQFPDLVSGPYGGMDPTLSQIILGEIQEAQPYKTHNQTWFNISMVAMPAWIALMVNARFIIAAPSTSIRWRWALHFILLATSCGLAIFYQRRFVAEMGLFTILPFTALLQEGWQWIGQTLQGRKRVYAEFLLILLVGPLSTQIYPALLDGRSLNTGLLLFPASSAAPEKCEMYELENYLRDTTTLGDHPRIIMNTLSSGPELLFRTNDSVLAAPFHMDVAGNIDSMRFFSTPYPEEAEAIARRRHIDLIVSCRYFPEVYLRPTLSKELSREDSTKDFAPHMIERLMLDKVPNWLKRVSTPTLPNYVIYEVLPPQ